MGHADANGPALLPRVPRRHRASDKRKEARVNSQATPFTPAQQEMLSCWQRHMQAEFATLSVDDALATMAEDPLVNHVPVLTGGVGREAVRAFYTQHFIGQMPPDTEMVPIAQTIGDDRLVEELVARFTHTRVIDWLLPGIPPTGRRVEVAVIAVVQFEGGKIAQERIYWDQASVLVQLGLLDATALPVAGVESARKVLDPTLPANALIERTTRGR
jgi:carboxymethylenebutenolidase